MILAVLAATSAPMLFQVSSIGELQEAMLAARPGSMIHIQPGTYRGGVSFSNIHGAPGKPIVVSAARTNDPPVFVGGGSGMHLSNVSHLELRDLKFEKATGNGLNIDDGGNISKPSHHLTLKRIQVSDIPPGNRDGIKLSGVQDFRIEGSTVQRWGGSAVDMVGCQRGVIENCVFRSGGDNAVQAKGGTSDIVVRESRFIDFGQRGVNLGGSTGFDFFRPPLAKMGDEKYEARKLTVEGCKFVRGGAPIAFVGSDQCTVRFNTIFDPGRWAIRILQETTAQEFLPCRNGVFSDNLVVFQWSNWSSGGVNAGSNTKPESFRFERNWWYCRDRASFSKPELPSPEKDGNYGQDPKVRIATDGSIVMDSSSPASKVGAHAFKPASAQQAGS